IYKDCQTKFDFILASRHNFENMISAHELKFSYGPHLVLEGVGFSVPPNWKVGLAGPNGAGKSTLLNLILGREKADFGKIEVVGSVTLVPQEVKNDPVMEASD